MKLQLPKHLGEYEVETLTDGISEDETVVGWIDEYGTVTDNDGNTIGDVVGIYENDVSVLIMKKNKVAP